MTRRAGVIVAAIAVLAAIVLPLTPLLGSYGIYLLTLVAIYGIVASGLTLFMGYAGQLSVGQAAFYGLGAYAAADLTKIAVPFPLALIAGAALSGAVGAAIGAVALRTRGFYLAVITLATGLIAVEIFKNLDGLTGGVSGLGRIPVAWLGPVSLRAPVRYWYFCLACLLLVVGVCRAVVRSPSGRAMRGIAAHELAAQSVGIDSHRIKAVIFALAAGFAGLAGGLYAHLARFVTPDDFGLIFSIQALTMAIVGGLSSVFGGIIGAAVVTVAGEWLRAFPAEQPILYGAALMLLVRYMPDGAAGAAARAGERLLSLRRGAKPKPAAPA
jgi:branched-chain amino acid transport system permease protein